MELEKEKKISIEEERMNAEKRKENEIKNEIMNYKYLNYKMAIDNEMNNNNKCLAAESKDYYLF